MSRDSVSSIGSPRTDEGCLVPQDSGTSMAHVWSAGKTGTPGRKRHTTGQDLGVRRSP